MGFIEYADGTVYDPELEQERKKVFVAGANKCSDYIRKRYVMQEKEGNYVYRRNRSVAIVVRNGKILMERVFYFGREFYTVPGGGIEEGETPEQAALRELKEECGLDGRIVRPLAVQYSERNTEYSFEVAIPEEQEPITGYDPEETGDNPPLKEVLWMSLDEINEKDRAFLWSYGLISVDNFYEVIQTWGNEVSYPKMN